MENNSSIHIQTCISSNVASFLTVITFITLPFHILIIKVLIVDLRLALPRHNTMLCLSISDALQVFILFMCTTMPSIFGISKGSVGCNISSTILYFTLTLTLVVSSLSTIALSVERYVACIHSFHLHHIFTRERMIYGILFVWILGVICGAINVILILVGSLSVRISDNYFLKVVTVLFVIPTCTLISVIQCRLLVFSRKKLARVGPVTRFGREAEMADFRKKQIKVAFVASIVVVAYIICMFPMGCLSLYELIHGNVEYSSWKGILERLLVVNNFADPFIYGIGTVDARKAVLKNLRKIKNFITRQS